MRRSFRIGCPAPADLVSPEAALLGKTQVSQWLFRLLELSIPLNDHFFSCLHWCADSLKEFEPILKAQIKAYSGRSRIHVRLRQSDMELLKLPEKQLDDALEEFADDHAWFQPRLRECLQSYVASRSTSGISYKSRVRSLQKIQKFFGLSNDAMKLCSLAFLTGNFRAAENYFEDTMHLHSFHARRTLSYMLDIHTDTFKNTLSQLTDMGILDINSTSIRL